MWLSVRGFPVRWLGGREVCDWRQRNKITIDNEACLPNMDDLFDTVHGCKYFTKLDLHSGYNQVRIRENDIPKTAMNTPLRHFEFKVMGFGLCDAPATFQSLMNEVLRPYLRKFVVVFLDILIFSKTWEDHFTHVRTIFANSSSTVNQANACLEPQKHCIYLGHVIRTGSTIAPDPQKLEAVKEWPVPRFLSDARSFRGVCEFLPKICSPLRRHRKASGWSHWQERSLLLEQWAPTLFWAVERGLIESSSAAIGQHISNLPGSHRCKWPGDWRCPLARRWTGTASSGPMQVASWQQLRGIIRSRKGRHLPWFMHWARGSFTCTSTLTFSPTIMPLFICGPSRIWANVRRDGQSFWLSFILLFTMWHERWTQPILSPGGRNRRCGQSWAAWSSP